ncbi:hypothetical protein BH18ACI3_BH18ACI3_05690 [soil metagenome]
MKNRIFAVETRRRGDKKDNFILSSSFQILAFTLCLCVSALNLYAQESPPAPSAPRAALIPAVQEKKLPNGLTVAVVERKNVPLVTVQLLVKSGASSENASKAGLADLTASMLTKGTKTRTATQIAEQMEFLGGSINTGAGWNNSVVTITVTSDKLDQAMAIMADVVLNPGFDQKELDLLKSQALDGLTSNLKQPGFLATYVASKYSFDEHPAGGTPESLKTISQTDVVSFHKNRFVPQDAILIFTGDISLTSAEKLSNRLFGKWKDSRSGIAATVKGEKNYPDVARNVDNLSSVLIQRLLVVDLPNSGQASVSYQRNVGSIGRKDQTYYPSSVLNSLLGGGYSSRLNQEIRIKQGLSYGAGSGFGWRSAKTNFSTRTQTKNESAAVVAELVLAEIKRLTEGSISDLELSPRKSVLTGAFGRNLETTGGLAAAVADLYSFNIPTTELNSYMTSVNGVTDRQIRDFAAANLLGGDIIIVGDYALFKDDLVKRFPEVKIEVVKANELDLSKDSLRN